MYPLTPLLAGQASVFTPPRRGSPEGEDVVSLIDNLKMVLCYQRFVYVLKLLFWTSMLIQEKKVNKVKVGIIGLGIGKWHLDSFKQTKDAEIVALCDANEERLKKNGEEAGITKLYTTIGSLLKMLDAI